MRGFPPIALSLALSLVPTMAGAADRTVGVGSFSRLRVDGAFEVHVKTGGSPAARVSGDRDSIGTVDVRSDGNTLTIRRMAAGTWTEQDQAHATRPIVVTLGTPALAGAVVIGNGSVTIDRMDAPRVDLSLTGAGGIVLDAVKAEAVNVQVIGSGAVTLAGRTTAARLMTNGPGTIDAAKLDTNDLVVRLDGLGTTRAQARYTAQVNNTGLGSVTVTGKPKCTVRALGGSPVICGARTPGQ